MPTKKYAKHAKRVKKILAQHNEISAVTVNRGLDLLEMYLKLERDKFEHRVKQDQDRVVTTLSFTDTSHLCTGVQGTLETQGPSEQLPPTVGTDDTGTT